MGESMILLNKTQIYGTGKNGDSKMLMNIQPYATGNVEQVDSEAKNSDYTTWTYPTDDKKGAESMTGKSNWPEIIEPCDEEMLLNCKDSPGCALIVGIAGLTDKTVSSYRLKGFYGRDKLAVDVPVKKEHLFPRVGDKGFDYYWFSISEAALQGPDTPFEYQISVAQTGKGDPDLFVSLMDGRSPTSNDYDFASTMTGADSIRIAYNDSFWAERGWDASAGVVVVVGVRMAEAGSYTLVRTSPATERDDFATLLVGESVLVTLPKTGDNGEVVVVDDGTPAADGGDGTPPAQPPTPPGTGDGT